MLTKHHRLRCAMRFVPSKPTAFEALLDGILEKSPDAKVWTQVARWLEGWLEMGVSENGGTPKSSISIGFSIINHPFWGTTIFGNIQIMGI